MAAENIGPVDRSKTVVGKLEYLKSQKEWEVKLDETGDATVQVEDTQAFVEYREGVIIPFDEERRERCLRCISEGALYYLSADFMMFGFTLPEPGQPIVVRHRTECVGRDSEDDPCEIEKVQYDMDGNPIGEPFRS